MGPILRDRPLQDAGAWTDWSAAPRDVLAKSCALIPGDSAR